MSKAAQSTQNKHEENHRVKLDFVRGPNSFISQQHFDQAYHSLCCLQINNRLEPCMQSWFHFASITKPSNLYPHDRQQNERLCCILVKYLHHM